MIFLKFTFFLCLWGISDVFSKNISLVAEFNTAQVNGTVLFLQSNQSDDSDVNLQFGQLNPKSEKSELFIHEFPVKYEGSMSSICKNIGKVFINTTSLRSHHLSGPKSIFGRSLAVQKNGSIIACATIKSYMSATKTVVGVFRAVSPGIAGTVVLRQAVDDPSSDTAVDINLMLVDARNEAMTGLSLTVAKTASTSNAEGSCEGIGETFNPLGKTSCDSRKASTCPIGDISAKLGQLNVPLPGEGDPHSFYIDTNLPLSGMNSVSWRSFVISSNGKPLICAKIQEFQEMNAEVMFDGLSGMIGFMQRSPYEPAVVNMSITGAQGLRVYEHVSDNCSINIQGNQLFNIAGSGAVDELTMYGPNSIMFQSITLNGPSQKCKQIQPKDATYHLKAQVHFNETAPDGLTGFVSFEQALYNKTKAFAFSSSILMSVNYKNNKTKKTSGHNWHVHAFPIGNDQNLPFGKKCKSAKGHYNPYKVYGPPDNNYAVTCNTSNMFRCELGDLSSKLGTYEIGEGARHFRETENYLASWHNIIGRSVVIHTANKGAPRFACADISPQVAQGYSSETLNVKNTTKSRDAVNFQKIVSDALKIESWRVADVKYEQMKSDKKCLTYKFLLIDDSKSDLHQAFAALVEDDPEYLKEFVPACYRDEDKWKINEGKTAEVVGVVFGIIILIIFVICMIFWLRRRRREQEDSSKLVEGVDAGAAVSNDAAVVSPEKNDNSDTPLHDPKKEWKVTTSL